MAQFANDNDAEQGAIETLYTLYNEYCAFGKGHRVKTKALALDGRTFVKFLRDSKLLTKNCTRTDADLIFTKVKPRGAHTMTFQGFITCLNEVAKRKNVRFEKLVDHIISTVQGPKLNHVSQAEHVRFHDDKSQYTGVYKHGGPTNIGAGGDGETVSLSKLADRSAYDIRGRKIKKEPQANYKYLKTQVYDNEQPKTRQRRLSSHGQQMLANVMRKTSVETPQKAMNIPLQQQARPQTAGGYAQQQQQQRRQQQNDRPKTARGGRGNIYDRLTDTSQYTGTHKHRFDSSGRGRGLAGRDRISKGGYNMGVSRSSNSREGQYVGNTNTNTDVTYNDLSDFIVRR
jgi:hypothetical protein